MKNLTSFVSLLLLFSCNVKAEQLTLKLPVYGVIKPLYISTHVAIGDGLIEKINYNVGDKIKKGDILITVLEKEIIRPYRSTLNGNIAKIHVTQSAASSVGMPLITVINPHKKFVEISLSPSEARGIHEGMKVFYAGNNKAKFVVKSISPIVDPDTGSVVVRVRPLGKIVERVGEVIVLEVRLGERNCDKVSSIDSMGKHIKNFKVEFLSGKNACLVKK